MWQKLFYKQKNYYETDEIIFSENIFRFVPQEAKLSLTMRIIAIECGFMLDSLVHLYFNM
ncbi:MAG: hypothetical protein ACJARD_000175 [Alphaproteobacteria bacterium]|jgi:hypothetical protein